MKPSLIKAARGPLAGICVFLFLGCFHPQTVYSQGINTNNAYWSELNLTGKIKGKFLYQLDYQFRMQGESDRLRSQLNNERPGLGDEAHGTYNIFAYPFQQVVRPWVHYQMHERVRLSWSPLGWWGTWYPTGVNSVNFQPEFRSTLMLTLTQPLGRVIITQRYRYEFRFFGKELPTDGSAGNDFYDHMTGPENRRGRLRYMARAVIPFNNPKLEPKTYYLNVYDEVFVGIGHNVKPERIFDQNRFFMGLGYKFNPALRVELGYLNQLVPKGPTTDMNHVLQLFVLVDDFNSFFRKKDQSQL